MNEPRMTFGDDGWIGVAGEEITDATVIRVVTAFLNHLRAVSPTGNQIKVAVAFDGRKDSRSFAELSARILSGSGASVLLCSAVVPSPVLSFITKDAGCAGGIMITGRDYPSRYNGIKLRNAKGGPLTHIESKNIRTAVDGPEYPRTVPDSVPGRVEILDPMPRYLAHIKSMIDLSVIEVFARDPKNTASVLIDSMGGGGQTIIEDILVGCGWRAQTLFGEAQPGFFDRSPETIFPNMAPLAYNVSVTDSQCGIATNGDGSAIGLVSGRGDWITTQETMLALLFHMHDQRRQRGAIIKGATMSDKVNLLASTWNVPFKEVGLGSIGLSVSELKGELLLGGEEGGRYLFPGHMAAADAILSGLMVIEMISKATKPIQAIIQSVRQKVGIAYCDQIELPYKEIEPLEIFGLFSQRIGDLVSGQRIKQKVNIECGGQIEGVKLVFGESRWIAIRLSNIFPTVRITAEGSTQAELRSFLAAAKSLMPA